MRVRAGYATLSFELWPGVWTEPLPWWWFEQDKDGKFWFVREPIDTND